jgi:hypothetical protein
MNTITDCYVKRIEDDVVWAPLDDAALIISTRETKETVTRLNKTAAYLWQQCDGTKKVAEIVAALCGKYTIDEKTALQDTLTFIEHMQQKQLLAVSPQALTQLP